MKLIVNTLVVIFCFYSTFDQAKAQSFCSTSSTNSSGGRLGPPPPIIPTQSCLIYTINVYIHNISTPNIGYRSEDINSSIINNLNNSYSQYEFYFVLSGSRDWPSTTYLSSSTPDYAFLSIGDDPNASVQANTVNIYVAPANSNFKAGFVPSNRKNVLIIGGTRTISNCSGGSTNYELPIGKVVCHEMGHCLGLVHTFEYSGDDDLSDTPIDYVRRNALTQLLVDLSQIAQTVTLAVTLLRS